MSSKSTIRLIATRYEELRSQLHILAIQDNDAPEAMQKEEVALARQLISLPACSSAELALKARVLLDWLAIDDVPGQLAASLCKDAIRLAQGE